MLCLPCLAVQRFSYQCATHTGGNVIGTAQKQGQVCQHLYSVAAFIASWLIDQVPCHDGGVIPIPAHRYPQIYTYRRTHICTYTRHAFLLCDDWLPHCFLNIATAACLHQAIQQVTLTWGFAAGNWKLAHMHRLCAALRTRCMQMAYKWLSLYEHHTER